MMATDNAAAMASGGPEVCPEVSEVSEVFGIDRTNTMVQRHLELEKAVLLMLTPGTIKHEKSRRAIASLSKKLGILPIPALDKEQKQEAIPLVCNEWLYSHYNIYMIMSRMIALPYHISSLRCLIISHHYSVFAKSMKTWLLLEGQCRDLRMKAKANRYFIWCKNELGRRVLFVFTVLPMALLILPRLYYIRSVRSVSVLFYICLHYTTLHYALVGLFTLYCAFLVCVCLCTLYV